MLPQCLHLHLPQSITHIIVRVTFLNRSYYECQYLMELLWCQPQNENSCTWINPHINSTRKALLITFYTWGTWDRSFQGLRLRNTGTEIQNPKPLDCRILMLLPCWISGKGSYPYRVCICRICNSQAPDLCGAVTFSVY